MIWIGCDIWMLMVVADIDGGGGYEIIFEMVGRY